MFLVLRSVSWNIVGEFVKRRAIGVSSGKEIVLPTTFADILPISKAAILFMGGGSGLGYLRLCARRK